MSGKPSPEILQFMQSFAIMRRVAPLYIVAACGLLFLVRPPVTTTLICAGAGIACGAVQLIAASLGQRILYVLAFVIMVVVLAALLYLRIPPFNLTSSEAVAVGATAVALQRTVCAYFHKFALGGTATPVKG
jgi:hypothetical protein